MFEPKILPSPRHTVVDQFRKFENLITSMLIDDPNLKAIQTGGVMAPPLYVVTNPFTRDFATGPLKRKAEKLLEEIDCLTKIVTAMAITPDEIVLLNHMVRQDDIRTPSETMERYLEVTRDLIESILIKNPGFKETTDSEGNLVDAEAFTLYPMTETFIRDVLPKNAEKILNVVGNACAICSVMSVSLDERYLLDDLVNCLDNMGAPDTEQNEDMHFSAPGM